MPRDAHHRMPWAVRSWTPSSVFLLCGNRFNESLICLQCEPVLLQCLVLIVISLKLLTKIASPFPYFVQIVWLLGLNQGSPLSLNEATADRFFPSGLLPVP